MPTYVASYARSKRRSRRSSRLIRRAVLLLLPLLILCSGWLALRHPAAADASQATVYVVQAGDSLWRIAQRHAPERMDIRAYIGQLRHLNQLEQSVIHVGQTLILPTR
ncbi:MAG: LysM peptidoglycan-binding domain-containing protein [Bacillota bacterium]|jgi:Tfp pilus assembly protein FimV